MSLQEKTLTGPGLTAMTWAYTYSQNKGYHAEDGLIPGSTWYEPSGTNLMSGSIPTGLNNKDYKWTTVSTPDGAKTKYYHNRDFSSAVDGSLIATEYFDTDGITLLKTSISEYTTHSTHLGGTGLLYSNVKPMEYRTDLVKTITQLHFGTVTDNYYTEYSSFNAYGLAQKTYEHNDIGNGKTRYSKQSGLAIWL
jgi:hypothetical protein